MKRLILLSGLLFTSITYSQVMCQDYFKASTPNGRTYWYDRFGKNNEQPIRFEKPMTVLPEQKQALAMGVAISRFDERFETRMYYSGTGGMNAKGEIPYVDPNAKAVFIFVHGSGTMASSGKNFYGAMNQLSALGFSTVSFDMPFHAEGPTREQFNDADYFMNWLDRIVKEMKKSGKPVYMVGHSFGPDVISEYVTRNPFAINGAVALSPAGFNKTLSDWYDEHTSKMNFGGDVQENRLAGTWAGTMSQQFTWNKTNGKNDPTVINPNFKYRMMSGNREEYVPAPVGGSSKGPIGDNTYDLAAAFKTHFKNAVTTIEPGVGHMIFNHSDKNGVSVILREILALIDLDGREIPNIRKEFAVEKGRYVTPTLRASNMYGANKIFKAYVDQKIGFRAFQSLVQKENHYVLNDLVVKYEEFKVSYDEKINNIILDSENVLPGFYKLNKAVIDAAKSARKKGTDLHLNLYDYLKTSKPEVIERLFAGI